MLTNTQNVLQLKNDENRTCQMLSFIVFGIYVANVAGCIESILSVSQTTVSWIAKAFLGICFFCNIAVLLRRMNQLIVCTLLGSMGVVLANLLFCPDNIIYFKETVFTYYTMCFMAFVFAATVRDYSLLKEKLHTASGVIVWITVGIVCFLAMGGRLSIFNQGKYSMGLGYSLILPVICLIEEYSVKRKVKDAVGAVALTAVIVAFGSRGPLVGIVLFGSYRLLQRWVYCRKYAWLICLIMFGVLGIVFADTIIENVILLLNEWGIQSRTLRLFLQESLYLSGRDQMYEQLLRIIVQQPFAIRGINAEWLLLDVYAHNIFLELVYQFGAIIGGLLCLTIVFGIIKTLKNVNRSNLAQVRFMFMCATIPGLMFSGSLWTNYGFWIWVALVFLKEQEEDAKKKNAGVRF